MARTHDGPRDILVNASVLLLAVDPPDTTREHGEHPRQRPEASRCHDAEKHLSVLAGSIVQQPGVLDLGVLVPRIALELREEALLVGAEQRLGRRRALRPREHVLLPWNRDVRQVARVPVGCLHIANGHAFRHALGHAL